MKSTIYEEFLELVAIDGEERERILPEWIEACKRMGLSEEDVRFSTKEWLPAHFELQYLGVRKILGALIREGIDHSKLPEYKAMGKKIVYGVLPALATTYLALKNAGGDDIFVSYPDLNMMVTLQCLFNKGGNYFEVAEQAGMTYGARHCALNKMRIGIRLKNLVPTPDVDWAWGFVCDEATKIDEYINCLYDEKWKTVITRLPHDTSINENGYDMPERVKYLAKELKYSMEEVEKIVGFKVTDKHVEQALKETQELLMVAGSLIGMNVSADPQPLSCTTLLLANMAFYMPLNTGLNYFKDGLNTLVAEVKRDIKNGIGSYPKGAPKIGFYFVPWALPWIDKIFKDNGVASSISLAFLPAKRQMEPSKYTDPWEKSAEEWLKHIFSMGCRPEIDDWIEKVNQFKPDAMIMGYLDYDRWIGALQKNMARKTEDATGVPCYYMEADFYDGRDYSPEALRTRIESICQIVKQKKAMKSMLV
ncbi:MAG TPA: 2-hydroxyacyl-CoA dehydratase family protein [Syntrophomonadaceae bacterium]|nr:2-hydroxyacyl-CoA dehydratase family protein [Syntrophomonadaceae bacterium]